ncbi:hypothetical protein DLAC_00881 [Tieghemostelium lacteum]|uniref:Uncharacterized protein n=1 Tax=Tieghemostelium lacteum TaxID=361077 RepID=A0A152A774_TIELA|nr:hypothetical protein DLAC_00881 [Tieghemostelium lacteum]|eukprot:KYR02080.1 hypothetical protein DLAC_00881 [Tieghemostelium lacteum]
MNRYTLASVLVIVVVLFSSSFTVNSYDLDESIDVYYLIAPLMKSKYGYLLANFNAFHAGLGFITKSTNEEYTVDFIAYPTITASIFPQIVNNTDSAASTSAEEPLPDLVWNTIGMVQYQEQIDGTYWTSREKMYTITGQQFKEYLCWLPIYNQSFPYYNLFDVQDTDTGDIFIPSSTCYDFVWSSFTALYALGGQLLTSTPPNRDYVTLMVTTEPNIVDHPMEPDHWKQITQFYSAIAYNPNESFQNYIGNLTILLNGTFFLHIDGKYYNLTMAPLNPWNVSYSPQPLPYGTADPSILNMPSTCFPTPPKKSSIGGGWIFIIILLCGSTTYLLIGVLVNKFLFKQHGIDLIPNRKVWLSFGSLIGDGKNFIVSKVTGNKFIPLSKHSETQPLI